MTRLTASVLARIRALPRSAWDAMPVRLRNALRAALGLGSAPPPVTTTGTLARIRTNGGQLIRVNVPAATLPASLALVDAQGRALPTQTTTVTRVPKGEPRMVEVMALGAGTDFALVAGLPAPAPAMPADMGLTLSAVDHVGTVYASQGLETLTRNGPVAITDERRGYLRGPSGDALLGFIMSETRVAGGDYTLVEAVVHNGPVPVAGDAYFRDLRVDVPSGYIVTHLLPHPWATSDGALIGANADGTMHVMLQKQVTEFRFAVHRPGDNDALSALRFEGFGVCVPGPGLWSPQNPATPWYFPQSLPMPTATAGMNFTSYPYDTSLGALTNALATGATLGGSNSGAAGPYHPWGSTYGGVTGGVGIWQWDGLGALLTGRADKLLEIMAYHRAITDRHRTGIFDANGNVQRAEGLSGGWKLAAYPGTMWKTKEGPLNWGAANQWRRDAVVAAGRLPAYENYLRGFEAIDFQHHGRRTAASTALVHLVNDPIARWALELEAEWARMFLYETGEGGLAQASAQSLQYPGKGGLGGREHGWCRMVIAAQSQVSQDPRLFGWMQADLAHLERAQLPSGGWMALEWGKPADGFPNDAVAQAIENGICVGGVQACYGATGDQRYLPLLRNAGDGHASYHWAYGKGAPYTRRAVRPKDTKLDAYTAQTAPAPLFTETDNWQSFAVLAAAMAAGSTEAELCVIDALGADPLASMLSKPLFQLDNRAALLAWYQIKGAK